MKSHKHEIIGIEALHIITMIMIVGLHYLNFGGILWQDAIWNRRIAWCIEAFCFVSVNCYVLISGYFLINSHSFHWSKVWKLWSIVAFYSLIFYIIFVSTSGHWSLYKTINFLLPVRYSIYWFITAYIGMYLLSPYLAKLAQNLNEKEYTSFICLLTGMFVLYSFLRPEADPFKLMGDILFFGS